VIKPHLNHRPEVAESASLAPDTTGRKRILLVEGDGFTRLVLLLRLRLAGFGVDFTSNGILGLGKVRSCHPDILLVELKLCGLSGLDLIKAARAEPGFGERPIYVFTHADRMNRATRKEVGLLATKVFDKNSITREDLVQIFATTLLSRGAKGTPPPAGAAAEQPVAALSEVAVAGAIEELIAGVREQSEKFARDPGPRAKSGAELLSRVSSLASCAKATGLSNLARQTKALEGFLSQLCRSQQAYTEAALSTAARAVEVMSRISHRTTGKQQSLRRFRAVFVDEAPYSNRAMEEALLNAGIDPVCFEDPARAREYLASNRTQLIIANVVLPEGHGLALADIRMSPLHGHTPVLYGPESTLMAPPPEELPVSAPRLDKAPLLLAELVVRALNELQSAGMSSPANPVPIGSAAPKPATTKPSLAAPPSTEDSFELFAKAPQPDTAAGLPLPVQSVSASTTAVHQPEKFSHLFTAAGIPNEPIMRAEPSAPSVDHEVEFQAPLPVSQTDEIQIEEQPIEAPAPSGLPVEVSQPSEPEAIAEDQTAEAAWLSVAASETGQTTPAEITLSPLEQNEPVAEQESAAAAANYGEVMNNQLRVASDDVPQGEASPSGEASNQQTNRGDLIARVCEAEMALYRAQMQIEQRDKALEALQKQLAEGQSDQSQASADAPAEANVAEQKAQARCAELEEEVAALRQAFEGLNGSFGEPQQASAETGKQIEELEQRLSQNATDLEKQKEEQQRSEVELRQQLEAATNASQQSETARQQAVARCSQLEQELNAARNTRDQSSAQAGAQKSKEQSDASPKQAEAQGTASDLEQQVRQGVTALARATAELAKERGERQRSQQLAADLNSRLQALHVDLSRTLQVQGENLSRISELEQQHHQTSEALDRSAADLEQHQAERRLAEEQLQKAKETNAQLRKDLSFFEEANGKFDGARQDMQSRLEANLNAVRENETRLQRENAERQRLAESLDEARRELQNQTRKQEALERELQIARDALQEREAKLQKEAAERERLNQTQDSVQHGLQDRTQRDLEFSKLQTALQLEQIERKRQETKLARTRQSALDAAHAARALRTSLRRQVREPVDSLIHSARNLLELEMSEEQKKLAEAVLQDVLLVQTRLREPVSPQGDQPEQAAPAAPAAS
jgi:DNA-binding response OmpR family regulator